MKRPRSYLQFALCFLLILCFSSAQAQLETKGKLFYGTVIKTIGTDSAVLFVSSEQATTVTITLFNSSTTHTRNIPANSLLRFAIDRAAIMSPNFGVVSTYGFSVQSTQDVSAYLLVPTPYTTDATILIPAEANPQLAKYRLLSYGATSGYNGGNEMAVVAQENNTEIDITLINTSGGPDSVETVILDKGETYQIKESLNYRISGGSVEVMNSNKKVSVFCGNNCTFVTCAACDMLYEQVPPEATLGKTFLISPFATHTNGYIIQCAATKDNTFIWRDGVPVDTLQEGDFYEYDVTNYRAICLEASNPVLVSQLMKGASCNGGSNGDPALFYLSPVEQLITSALVATSNTAVINSHYVSIIIPKRGIDSLFIDGVRVPRSKLIATNCDDYYWYTDTVTPGSHHLRNSFGFLAYVYGMGGYESYGYTAGSGLRNLEMEIEYTEFQLCDSGSIFSFNPSDSSSQYYEWFFHDGTSDSGLTSSKTYSKVGEYLVRLAYQANNSGLIDTAYLIATVAPKEEINFILKDTIAACTDSTYLLQALNIPIFNYLWSNDSTTTSILIEENGLYTLIVTDTSTGCELYDTAYVEFFEEVAADFNIENDMLCQFADIRMTEDVSYNPNSDSILHYNWYIDYIFTKDGKKDTLFNASPNNYDIELKVISENGCRDSIVKRVTVAESPLVEFSIDTITSCFNNNQFEFRDYSTASFGKIDSIIWYFHTDTVVGRNFSKSFDTIGTFNGVLRVTVEGGCQDTANFTYKIVESPNIALTIIDSSFCLKSNFIEGQAIAQDTQRSAYLWDWGDGTLKAFTKPTTETIQYTDTGSYQIQLIQIFQGNSCSDTAFKWVHINNGGPTSMIQLDSFDHCFNENFINLTDISSYSDNGINKREWIYNDSMQLSDSSVRISFDKEGQYNIYLALLDENGCRDTAKRQFTVHPVIPADFSISNEQNCLSNNLFTFKNDLANGNTNYRWDVSDGRILFTKNDSINLSFTQTGMYTVLASTETPLYGCKDTFGRNIVVYPNIMAKGSLFNDQACIGANLVELYDSTDYGFANMNNLWKINGFVYLADASPVALSFDSVGTYNFELIAGRNSSCPDTLSFTTEIVDIPEVDVVVNTNDQCLKGNEFIFTTNLNGDDNIINYLWRVNGSTSSNASTSSTFTSSGNKLITLEFETDNGCKDTVFRNVSVHPQLDPVISSNRDTQCLSGNSYDLFALQGINSDSISFMEWDLGDGITSNAIEPRNINYSIIGEKLLRVITTSHRGCKDTAEHSLFVADMPIANFFTDTVCLGIPSTFTSTSSSASAIDRYIWEINGDRIVGKEIETYTFLDTGVYSSKLIIENIYGCRDSIEQINSSLVMDIPFVDFDYVLGLENNGILPIQLNNLSDNNAVKFRWNYQGMINTLKDPQFNITALGEFPITLYAENIAGCGDSVTKWINPESLIRAHIPNAFSPNNDGLNETFGPSYLERHTDYQCKIFNRWGEMLFYSTDAKIRWDGTYDGKACQQDVYLFKISYINSSGIQNISGTLTLLR